VNPLSTQNLLFSSGRDVDILTQQLAMSMKEKQELEMRAVKAEQSLALTKGWTKINCRGKIVLANKKVLQKIPFFVAMISNGLKVEQDDDDAILMDLDDQVYQAVYYWGEFGLFHPTVRLQWVFLPMVLVILALGLRK